MIGSVRFPMPLRGERSGSILASTLTMTREDA
ncbi:MAG: hypothetical protein QOD13_3107 [Thermoleophilaceae bacterium]|nr:hypothetical protein [Thermoleophilaceae bacterium]